MRRRRFSTTTFSELFVLLAIVFLAQTVIHFTLSSEPIAPLPRQRWLFINQYPSGMDATDHVRYIAIGSEVLVVHPPVLGCDLFAFRAPARSRALPGGGCERSNSNYTTYPVTSDAGGESAKIAFIKAVNEKYGVTFSMNSAPRAQNKFTLLLDARQRRTGFDIRVGICICELPNNDINRRIPAEWNIRRSVLERPHPIVFDFVSVGETVRNRQEIAYSHHADFSDASNELLIPDRSHRLFYAMAGDKCDVAVPRSDLRKTFIREYVVTDADFERI